MTERRFRYDPDEMWWAHDAACVGHDPELFFPIGSGPPAAAQASRAKAICRTCPVRDECLEWSLATYQDAGVWGGLDEEERRVIRRARRRAAATAALAATG
jgi:WhiB family transcriptional regulator, redox-sensing transcriptional regulator